MLFYVILIFSIFKNNASPNGVVGVTFKDLEFHGINHFIYNRGPSIRVSCGSKHTMLLL